MREPKVVSRETQAGPPTFRGQPIALTCDACDAVCELAVEVSGNAEAEYGPCHYCFACVRRMWGIV